MNILVYAKYFVFAITSTSLTHRTRDTAIVCTWRGVEPVYSLGGIGIRGSYDFPSVNLLPADIGTAPYFTTKSLL